MPLNKPEKRLALKQFPLKNHFLATPTFKRTDLEISKRFGDESSVKSIHILKGGWNKSTKAP